MLAFSLFVYLFCMNVLAFTLYAEDKRRAFHESRRIPEWLLLMTAILGGSYGAGAGMLLYRHKTQHSSFILTVSISFALWMALLVFLCLK